MDKIHKIQERMAEYTQADKISEEAYRILSQDMSLLATKYQQLEAEANLLNYKGKLDIIKICLNNLKEIGEDNDEVYVECYATIGRTQLSLILNEMD
tara:strand:- start:481 stop:771 length:291 start_codon:yes stop_codon:yes gene_type:complete